MAITACSIQGSVCTTTGNDAQLKFSYLQYLVALQLKMQSLSQVIFKGLFFLLWYWYWYWYFVWKSQVLVLVLGSFLKISGIGIGIGIFFKNTGICIDIGIEMKNLKYWYWYWYRLLVLQDEISVSFKTSRYRASMVYVPNDTEKRTCRKYCSLCGFFLTLRFEGWKSFVVDIRM